MYCGMKFHPLPDVLPQFEGGLPAVEGLIVRLIEILIQ
jgi:hypothetical protein